MRRLIIPLMLCASCDDPPPPPARAVSTSGTVSNYLVRFGSDGDRTVVYATLPTDLGPPLGQVAEAEGRKLLSVAPIDATDLRPLDGSYVRTALGLEFRPRTALEAGRGYRATLRVADDITATDHYAARGGAVRQLSDDPPSVVGSYPTGDELPANHSHFYVHFSAPIEETEDFFEHVVLSDTAGGPVERPWRALNLWSVDRQLVTLLLDRTPRPETNGPLLQVGHTYTLRLDDKLRGKNGRPLASAYDKRFRVIEPDTSTPDPKQWRLAVPKAGSTDPLIVDFGESMDHVVLMTSVTMALETGAHVVGEASAGERERSWRFVPGAPWVAQRHIVHVDPRIEDLAGNTTQRKVHAPDDTKAQRVLISMDFTPK